MRVRFSAFGGSLLIGMFFLTCCNNEELQAPRTSSRSESDTASNNDKDTKNKNNIVADVNGGKHFEPQNISIIFGNHCSGCHDTFTSRDAVLKKSATILKVINNKSMPQKEPDFKESEDGKILIEWLSNSGK